MNIKQFHIYLANLDPPFGAEPGKVRPVIVIQTDFLNDRDHSTTIVCPITTQIIQGAYPLRLTLNKSVVGLKEDSDILIDQIRAIDNRCFIKEVGYITKEHQERLMRNLQVVLFE